VRNGVVTLHLNGETFSIPLDETKRLGELSQLCGQLGEDRLSQQLKAIVEEVGQPRPIGAEAIGLAALAAVEEMKSLMDQLRSRSISPEDFKSVLAIKEHIRKRLSVSFGPRIR
jgi:hypothetical protein